MRGLNTDKVATMLALYRLSTEFRVEVSHEEADVYLDKLGDDDGLRILRAVDEVVPRMMFGPNNPNNGRRHLRWFLGREGTPVMYVEVIKSYLPGHDFAALQGRLEGIGHAVGCDEVTVTDDGAGALVVRYWWD